MIRFKRQFEMAGGIWRERPKRKLRLSQLLAIFLSALLLYWIIPISEEERVTVTVATAVRKDMPVYLDLPGTVQAYQTVVVHTQAEGQLDEVLFEEGQDVKAGDVLARLDPSSFQARYNEAVANKAQDENMLQHARQELEALRKAGGKSAKGVVEAKRSAVQQFEAAVQSDNVTIEQLKNQLNRTVITAPIDGRTGIRQVDAGNVVHPTDLNGLVMITQMEPISVLFSLPQKNLLAALRNLDKSKRMKVQALEVSNHNALDAGELEIVDNKVDPGNGSILLKATFPNEKRLLWPGAKVTVRLLMATHHDALVVPASAIQPGQPKPSVFVYRPSKGKVDMRPVKVAMMQDDEAMIEEGVRAGEQVVIDSMKLLQDGSHVLVQGAGTATGAQADTQADTQAKTQE